MAERGTKFSPMSGVQNFAALQAVAGFFAISIQVKKCRVKPVNNNHHWDPNIVAVVDRWSLFKGRLSCKNPTKSMSLCYLYVQSRPLYGICS